MSMQALSDRSGVCCGYLTQVSRGRRNMGARVQAQVEAVLEAPARVESARRASVDPQALWERMDAHGLSQNEVARRAGISSAHLSKIMNGRATPSGEVLRKLHGVLFQPTAAAELVVPAEVKVMAWKKAHGLGRLRVRGGRRVRLAVYLKALACNFKRMVHARLVEMENTAQRAVGTVPAVAAA